MTVATTKTHSDGLPDLDPNAALLDVSNLQVEFRTRAAHAYAVNGVSFSLEPGETLSILGESGSGKSVTAQAIMGILDTPPGYVTGGAVRYRGVDLLQLPEQQRRQFRANNIAMVFQDALSALNPVFSVGFQLAEQFRIHRGMSRSDGYKKAVELMDMVRIPAAPERVKDYPHEFSGGMRQRVMIAMALALDPDILIADEPTTALDVTVQAQIMRLLADLQRERHMGMILITHDMGVVANVADRISVMYAGRVVESAPVHEIYARPSHPYTKALLESVPRVDQKGEELSVIKGLPPTLSAIPEGCAFNPRCTFARDVCRQPPPPPLYEVNGEHSSACHFWEEVRASE